MRLPGAKAISCVSMLNTEGLHAWSFHNRPIERSGAAIALDSPAGMTSEGLAPTRQWGFASDARAALLVCLFTADTLVIACSGIVSYLIRIGSFSLPQPNWAHIILACLAFGNVMLIAGAYRFAALRHHRQHLTRVTGFWVLIMLMLIA